MTQILIPVDIHK